MLMSSCMWGDVLRLIVELCCAVLVPAVCHCTDPPPLSPNRTSADVRFPQTLCFIFPSPAPSQLSIKPQLSLRTSKPALWLFHQASRALSYPSLSSFDFPKAAFRYLSPPHPQVIPNLSSATMSTAVDSLADNLAQASIQDPPSTAPDNVLASAAEGRRLYIGNLAYATTEGELKEFFSAYKVWVNLQRTFIF